jgi:large subunit ribosomal protein LX
MSKNIWRVKGHYYKRNRRFVFGMELTADREDHVREKILSELGSRHRVKRDSITFSEVTKIKPEEVTDLDLRKALGLESEFA